LLGFLSANGNPDQFLFTARLRSGTARDSKGVIPLLRRTLPYLKRRFPRARILVRMDGGFSNPKILDVIEELKCFYLVGFAKNSLLSQKTLGDLLEALNLAKETGNTSRVFAEIPYQTKSWKKPRRIIYKAEYVLLPGETPRENPRYVVTNLKETPEQCWRMYAGRGDSENRIKELKNDLCLDRTSCSRFVPNQFRVLMTSIAFVLFQELRARAKGSDLAQAQVQRLRNLLVKVGGRVLESTRRIVMHFPANYGWMDSWLMIARRLGAVSP